MNLNEAPIAPAANWYAMRVKARSEQLVASIVRRKGFDGFVPVYPATRRWSDRLKTTEFPLFPGYVFCRLRPQERLRLLTIPGVLHFVGIGTNPVPIEPSELAAIRAAAESGLRTQPWPFLEAGQKARLEDGPLTGLEGVLLKGRKQYRMIVSVSLLRESIAVDIDRCWVAPRSEASDGAVVVPCNSADIAKAGA